MAQGILANANIDGEISDYTFSNTQGEDIVNFESGIDQIIQPKLYGKSTQVQTKGYQLFDASKISTKSQGGATVTNNGDGSFTISGNGNLTSEFSTFSYVLPNISWLKVGKLKLSGVQKTVPGLQIIGYNSNQNTDRTFVIATNIGKLEVEITEDIVSKTKGISIIFFGNNGLNIEPATIKPMLYQDGDGTWEPFTGGKPTPTPDNPSEIVNKEVREISVTGKNLLNISSILSDSTSWQYKEVKLKPNTTYTVASNTPQTSDIALFAFNTSDTATGATNQVYNGKAIQVTTTINGIVKFQWRLSNTSYSFKNYKYQIEEGTVGTSYQPYQNQTITLSKPITLRGIQTDNGNITIDGKQYVSDVITEKNGVIGVERNVKESLLNGSENYTYATSETHNSFGVSADKLNKPDCKVLCNKMFFYARTSSLSANDYGILVGNYINIYVPKINQEVTNVDTFKQWLAKNPLTVCFEPYKPTFEPLPQVDQDKFKTLLAHKGVNTLFTNAYIDLNYISSNKYVLPYPIYSEQEIDKKFGDVETNISNVQNELNEKVNSRDHYASIREIENKMGDQVTFSLSGTTLTINTK